MDKDDEELKEAAQLPSEVGGVSIYVQFTDYTSND